MVYALTIIIALLGLIAYELKEIINLLIEYRNDYFETDEDLPEEENK